MNWKASPPGLEIAAAWTAAWCLGGATAFAVARLAPLGAGLVEAGGAGVFVALAALFLIERVDRRRGSRILFAAPETPDDYFVTEDGGLPDRPVDDDVLLLDDPLPAVGEDSRVVRLFAPHCDDAAATLAGPGEMAARIENFLGKGRRGAVADALARDTDRPNAEDASAALHAALADIRRSLRQG